MPYREPLSLPNFQLNQVSATLTNKFLPRGIVAFKVSVKEGDDKLHDLWRCETFAAVSCAFQIDKSDLNARFLKRLKKVNALAEGHNHIFVAVHN